MRLFQPSPAFQTFFNQIIADAERPVTAGTYAPAIPDFPDPEEQAFAHTQLAELIRAIHAMKQSVTPTTISYTVGTAAAAAEAGVPGAQEAYEQLLWQQASSGAP